MYCTVLYCGLHVLRVFKGNNIVLQGSVNKRRELFWENGDRYLEHTSSIPRGCQQYACLGGVQKLGLRSDVS